LLDDVPVAQLESRIDGELAQPDVVVAGAAARQLGLALGEQL
jgi:hypothetical protein